MSCYCWTKTRNSTRMNWQLKPNQDESGNIHGDDDDDDDNRIEIANKQSCLYVFNVIVFMRACASNVLFSSSFFDEMGGNDTGNEVEKDTNVSNKVCVINCMNRRSHTLAYRIHRKLWQVFFGCSGALCIWMHVNLANDRHRLQFASVH